jgi:hypothetical protein
MFPLARKSVEVRGQSIVIREWTAAERNQFVDIRKDSPAKALLFMVSTCVAEPAGFDADGVPAGVIDELLPAILSINGMGDDPKND